MATEFQDQGGGRQGTPLSSVSLDALVVAQSHILTGGLPSPTAGLSLSQPATAAVINMGDGTAVAVPADGTTVAAATIPCAANSDTYFDLDANGTYDLPSVPNGSAPPAQAAGTIRLYKAVSDATDITAVVQLAPTQAVTQAAVAADTVEAATNDALTAASSLQTNLNRMRYQTGLNTAALTALPAANGRLLVPATQDFVLSGGLPTLPATGPTYTQPAVEAWIKGAHVVLAAQTLTAAPGDNYVDLDSSGVYHVQTVAHNNGFDGFSGAPAVYANSIRLYAFYMTAGNAMSSLYDERQVEPRHPGPRLLYASSDGGFSTSYQGDATQPGNWASWPTSLSGDVPVLTLTAATNEVVCEYFASMTNNVGTSNWFRMGFIATDQNGVQTVIQAGRALFGANSIDSCYGRGTAILGPGTYSIVPVYQTGGPSNTNSYSCNNNSDPTNHRANFTLTVIR